MNRVAVTGLGTICSLGHTTAEFRQNLMSGVGGIRPLTDPGRPPYKFANGAEVLDFDPLEHFSDKDLIMLERFAQFAAVAAREAVRQSGFEFSDELGDQTAVVTGTSVGGQFSEEEGYQRLYRDGNPKVAPLTIPRTMANAGASRICMEHGITGPSFTISTACSSSNHAIGQAFSMVRTGSVKAAIAGGSEAIFVEGLLRAWEAMRVVSPDVCRPFSLDRRGLSLGEGAGMLFLENWTHAQARGAEILGEIAGFAMSSDAHHLTQPSVEGPTRSMKWALQDAQVNADDIGHINAHGTGTQANDQTEAAAIHAVFGPGTRKILVTSTKSLHGHTLGAAGAIEAVATLLSLQQGLVPPTINFIKADPACNLNVVTETGQSFSSNCALSNSFAFGGLNATLVLKRFTG